MGTYLDLQTNIANDLSRSDLTSQIQSAIGDAIKNYETSRFFFNVTRTLTFPTVVGQSSYTGTDLAQIPNVIRIDSLWLQDSTSIYKLDRYEPNEFEWLQGNSTGSGRPSVFCYEDSSLLLWPVPVAVYTMRPHMHYRLNPLVNSKDENAWCDVAEQLIRCHAKLLLYTNVIEDPDGMQRMSAQIQTYLDRLAYETSARTSTGRIRATEF